MASYLFGPAAPQAPRIRSKKCKYATWNPRGGFGEECPSGWEPFERDDGWCCVPSRDPEAAALQARREAEATAAERRRVGWGILAPGAKAPAKVPTALARAIKAKRLGLRAPTPRIPAAPARALPPPPAPALKAAVAAEAKVERAEGKKEEAAMVEKKAKRAAAKARKVAKRATATPGQKRAARKKAETQERKAAKAGQVKEKAARATKKAKKERTVKVQKAKKQLKKKMGPRIGDKKMLKSGKISVYSRYKSKKTGQTKVGWHVMRGKK